MPGRLDQFDLNLLRALDALLRERSVTRAAQQLHVTQQAMSGSLKRMREHFGDDLLVRNGLRLELTPLGAALMSPVREVLLQSARTLGVEPSFDPAVASRRFRISMSDYAVFVFLPLVLRRLTTSAPNIVCEVHPLNEHAFDGLDAGDLDLCVLPSFWRRSQRDRPDAVRSLALYDDDFVCVVDATLHDFDEMTLERYLDLPHAAARLQDSHRTIIEDAWVRNRIAPRIIVSTLSFTDTVHMVPGTSLVATAQRRLAMRLLHLLPIRLMECPVPIDRLDQELSWHARADDDPGHRFMREVFVAAATDMDAGPTA